MADPKQSYTLKRECMTNVMLVFFNSECIHVGFVFSQNPNKMFIKKKEKKKENATKGKTFFYFLF